jgi:hypothetical protein
MEMERVILNPYARNLSCDRVTLIGMIYDPVQGQTSYYQLHNSRFC